MSKHRIEDIVEFKDVVYTKNRGYSIVSYGKINRVEWATNDKIIKVIIKQIFDVRSYLEGDRNTNSIMRQFNTNDLPSDLEEEILSDIENYKKERST